MAQNADRDPRIPVRVGEHPVAGAAVLAEGDAPVPPGVPVARFRLQGLSGHAAGCPCCLPRGPVAEALGRLFLASARGEIQPFTSVVAIAASPAGRRAIAEALARDPLVQARFRAG